MSLSNGLVEQFRALHQEKYDEDIGHDRAELCLKELAELVRITTSKQKVAQNA